MPNVLRSRLLALAFAACAFACLTTVTLGDTAPAQASRVQVARERLGPPIPKRHILRSFRHKHKRTLGERAARIALKAVGVPYHWGGSSPSSGFDCSGLVYWAYEHVGVTLPHSSYALAGMGRRVRHLRPGDLLFFSGYGHVGIYIGRGRMVHAPHTGTRVQVVRLGHSHYGDAVVGARRVTHA
ncbi:MAG TPA: C40 family peptidase [Gaiellaceae bacterium]|jgi:cell wall-associated NlpC family hydrolase